MDFSNEWLFAGIVFRLKHEDKIGKDQTMHKGLLEKGGYKQPIQTEQHMISLWQIERREPRTNMTCS